jgi:hypothetical protein
MVGFGNKACQVMSQIYLSNYFFPPAVEGEIDKNKSRLQIKLELHNWKQKQKSKAEVGNGKEMLSLGCC